MMELSFSFYIYKEKKFGYPVRQTILGYGVICINMMFFPFLWQSSTWGTNVLMEC
jgi:hypothetical protein